jgi:hypothetical protein
MLDHNHPKDHGKPLAPKTGAATIQFYAANSTQTGDISAISIPLVSTARATVFGWLGNSIVRTWRRG